MAWLELQRQSKHQAQVRTCSTLAPVISSHALHVLWASTPANMARPSAYGTCELLGGCIISNCPRLCDAAMTVIATASNFAVLCMSSDKCCL
jgi:hypothetical protein